MKSKREETAIRIRLKGVSQTKMFNPGDIVSCIVEIYPESPIICRDVQITFGWHTEGKGDKDSHDIDTITLPITEIRPEAPLGEHFEFTMPESPWSFSGHLISIVWSVNVKVDIAKARDLNESLPLVLQPLETR